ncbi:hypothetical protein [Methylomonas methanica]|uniref:hypothetical protein n=1 Tax=Methylomonas methanica TaxID=421 RepID=UPI0011D262F8|nr:hypothetical protein [Methylomonas methanica]
MIISFLNQNQSSKTEESRWFHHCTEKNIPYVITRKRTSLGDIEWDYVTLHPESDVFLRSQKEFIEHELNALFKYYQHDAKTIEHLGSLTGYVKNLPIEHVNDFATDVCNTLTEAYNRHVKSA